MKVVMISCFVDKKDYSRSNFIYEYFRHNKYDCKMIYSKYNHCDKKNVIFDDENWIPINTIKYKKNISILRLLSHLVFGIKAASVLKCLKPDIVYIAAPPNSAIKFPYRIAKKMNCKVIIDIVDMWPESFPKFEKLNTFARPAVNIWKDFRNSKISSTDVLMLECNYYKEFLEKNHLHNENTHIVYIAKDFKLGEHPIYYSNSDKSLNICYLGSINSLIDIELIIKLFSEVNKLRKVKLHIIGEGESKELFLSELEKNGIQYMDYGIIYNNIEKNKIMSICDFGINMYKFNLVIGLTYKSIDYLSAGLPLINTIKGDTWDFVSKEGVGINYENDKQEAIISRLTKISGTEINQLKLKSYSLYLNNFESSAVTKKLDSVMETMLKS